MGFYTTGKRGTMRDNRMFNALEACMKLYKAMRGLGTDEASVVTVVSTHSFAQRGEIRKKYLQIYKKDLLKELDSELSLSFGKLVLALMSDPEEYILESIHSCVVKKRLGGKTAKKISSMFSDGLSRTELVLLSLLCPRTNADLAAIKEQFQAKYQLDLLERIRLGGNDLSEDFSHFIEEFIEGKREEEKTTKFNSKAMERDVDKLIAGGSEAEELFESIIVKKSWVHLACVFVAYSIASGNTIEDFIESAESYSKELKGAYKTVVLLLTDQPMFYAERLKGAIRGAGTDDDMLIRVLVLRSELDLIDVMDVYETKFGISLADDVASDTSGDYKDLLMKIICVPSSELESEPVTRLKSNDEEEDNVSGESSTAKAVRTAIRMRTAAGWGKHLGVEFTEECGQEE